MRSVLLSAILVLMGLSCSPQPSKELLPSLLFSDGMIAQRDVPFPVWGVASPGTEVQVTLTTNLGSASESVDAGMDGKWWVEFAARPAGVTHTLVISGGGASVEINDLVFGDVWIASGQSNMEWVVSASRDADAEIAAADDPMIRHFKVPLGWAPEPQDRLEGGAWARATPEHVGAFSAVGYYFAREVRRHVDVPIGIINTSWGGSRIEPWMSVEALGIGIDDVRAVLDADAAETEELRARIVESLGDAPDSDPGLVDGVAHWASPDLDMSLWHPIEVPGQWETQGYDGLDGIGWYRTTFELSEADAASGVRLGAGQIDDSDITWVNGSEVGRTEQQWNTAREYIVPASALRTGENVIAIRVEDTGGGGGIWGSPDLLWIETASGSQSLAGEWQFRIGEVVINSQGRKNQMPTLLYHQMIHPLLQARVAGFLWYQGESNAGGQDAVAYADQFQAMITDWRTRWNAGDAPFLWVQLANYLEAADEPLDSDWAVLRESQSAALDLPNTAEAVIIDIGEADDIHPRNKQDVGLRLSLAARHFAYGEDLVFSGPRYRAHRVEGRNLIVAFDHVGSGLTARGGTPGGTLGGFAIAGADGAFTWADARIVGRTVVVSSRNVQSPAHVRYAWANNPDRANLYNAEGLPASPFRTGR